MVMRSAVMSTRREAIGHLGAPRRQHGEGEAQHDSRVRRGEPEENRGDVAGEDWPEFSASGLELFISVPVRVEVLAAGIRVEGGNEPSDRQDCEAFTVTKTRSRLTLCKASAMSLVGNGRNEMTSRGRRLMRSSRPSARVRRSVMASSASHAAPMVKKLTT
jgi:hypothetical protein